MQFSAEEYRLLAGRRFNEILAADEEMKSLQAQQYDRSAETRVLLEVLSLGDFRIGRLPVRPLTAARWAFLWMLESPFAAGGKIQEPDLDVALFVLSTPDLREIPCAIPEIPAAASSYALSASLPPEEIIREIECMIQTAFSPLALLPPAPPSDVPGEFDALWVTRIAGIAALESGMGIDHCMHRMSLSAVCCFYVNRIRRESENPALIRRRPSAELEEKITKRFNTLAENFLRNPQKD